MAKWTKLSKEEQEKNFIDSSKSLWNGYYDYSKMEFSQMKKEIEVVCPVHGSFMVTPTKHLHGKGCPVCGKYILYRNRISSRRPYSEISAMKFFVNNNIEFIYQYAIGKFHVDFYIPNKNIAIELHGSSHYKPVLIFGGNEKLEKSELRDMELKELCKKSGINLVFIKTGDGYDKLENELKMILNVK